MAEGLRKKKRGQASAPEWLPARTDRGGENASQKGLLQPVGVRKANEKKKKKQIDSEKAGLERLDHC